MVVGLGQMISRNEMLKLCEGIDGWMEPCELEWLYDRAAELKSGSTWVEIGSWKGKSFTATACGLRSGSHMVCVDHWRGSSDEGSHNQARMPGRTVLQEFCTQLCKMSELRPSVLFEILVGPSASFKRKADVVFIDGCHQPEAVLADLLHWHGQVRRGGMLCGHDRQHDGVSTALQRYELRTEVGPGSIWFCRV